ncbi:MAG: hypothetical protein WCC97_20925 [Candidatus Acidiferrales bacterium]
MRNSTENTVAYGGREHRIRRKANEIDDLRSVKMRMDFGEHFAYKGVSAHGGKSRKGEYNGQESQETVEESKEAGSNQTAN